MLEITKEASGFLGGGITRTQADCFDLTDRGEKFLGHLEIEPERVGGNELEDGGAGFDPLTGFGRLSCDGTGERGDETMSLDLFQLLLESGL